MDSDTGTASPPSIPIRWFRPTTSTPVLQLPTAPISVTKVDSWVALSVQESAQCEEAWHALSDEQKLAAEVSDNIDSRVGPLEDLVEEDQTVGVTISEDKLFEVDVKNMEIRPIYWRLNTPHIKVRRAAWLYDEVGGATRPVPKHLADQLDVAYRLIQPWQPSYRLELETAACLGVEAYEKLRHPIILSHQSRASQLYVIFENAFTAKLTPGITSSFFGSRRRPTKTRAFTFSGTTVYYGYDAALARMEKSTIQISKPQHVIKEQAADLTSSSGVAVDVHLPTTTSEVDAEFLKSHVDKDREPSHVGEEGVKKVTDLVLIVHGIGQGLASQYEGWSFLYAVNHFRQLAKKQAMLPALASILREKQVQFLPVQWRASMNIGEEEQRERERDGLDNTFGISDITLKKSIPAIRELTNNVLIEVPYFMSHHRTAMIESVCMQANRTYRMWCARNPGFDKYGRVHIIGHSLGSLLSAYILSKQPTLQPSLSLMDPYIARQCRSSFLFNTSAFFVVGSPLSVFVHLNHAQLIARKGRERTLDSPDDEALDREGLFGCFAIDSLYNIFHPSDPVAYLLNPCVDAKSAKDLPPSTVPSFNASVMSSISTRFSKLFGDIMPRSFGSTPPLSRAHSSDGLPAAGRAPGSGFELSGHNQVLQGSRAERRFAALNPHGTLDFQLASEGSISEYVDMITAHSSYWQDANLAAFVLVELFANQQDLARTGLVPATIARS